MTAPRGWMRMVALALTLVAAGAVAFVLTSGPAGNVVARVARIEGDVQRDERGHENQWHVAGVGDELVFGDAVRTGDKAKATVVLADGSSLDLEPGTLVRFLEDAQEAPRFRVDTGLALFESTGTGLSIATSTGVVHVDPRTRVRIAQDDAGLRMEVTFGRASFLDADQAAQALMPGDELSVRRGETQTTVKRKEEQIEVEKGPRPGDELPLLTSTGAIDVAFPEEAAEKRAPSVVPAVSQDRADLTVRAGESATVHQPKAGASHVRLRFADACGKGEATVETAGAKGKFRAVGSSSSGALVILVRPGTTRYRVRCNDKPGRISEAGSVRLVRDAAVRRVPLKPPTNALDLDGRRYTVMYQNRLPSVIARFSKVPAGVRSRVVVQSGTRMRTYEGEGNSVKVVSGQLGDGDHQIFLETLDGKLRSPTTTLRIAFDNAAPTASFDQHGTLERDATGHAQVSGVVPQGARVSLEGQTLMVDASGRFSGNALVAGADAAVALRVEHPRAGLHYYVRHVAGESVVR